MTDLNRENGCLFKILGLQNLTLIVIMFYMNLLEKNVRKQSLSECLFSVRRTKYPKKEQKIFGHNLF